MLKLYCALCSVFMFANLFIGVLLLAMHDGLKNEDEFYYGTLGRNGYISTWNKNLEKQECSISEADAVEYPNCREKMQWMEKG